MDADHAALAEENASLKAELAIARAKASEDMALIAEQKLRIAKLEHHIYGQRSERSARVIEQLALTFEELESSATEDELAAEQALARTTTVSGFTGLGLQARSATAPRRISRHGGGAWHGDDTTVPVLAKGKTDAGRCWINVRDNKPFGGAGPPAAMFYYSRDRRGEHPQANLAGYAGILQADAYDGYNRLYLGDRKPGPIKEAACSVHARMSAQLPKLTRGHDLVKAINYMLKRWAAFTLFLEDGRVCLGLFTPSLMEGSDVHQSTERATQAGQVLCTYSTKLTRRASPAGTLPGSA